MGRRLVREAPTWAKGGTVKSMRPSPLQEYISRAMSTLVTEFISSLVFWWEGGIGPSPRVPVPQSLPARPPLLAQLT